MASDINFESSILISERCVTDDVFPQFILKNMKSVARRQAKLGAEEITRDIPNISEEV